MVELLNCIWKPSSGVRGQRGEALWFCCSYENIARMKQQLNRTNVLCFGVHKHVGKMYFDGFRTETGFM